MLTVTVPVPQEVCDLLDILPEDTPTVRTLKLQLLLERLAAAHNLLQEDALTAARAGGRTLPPRETTIANFIAGLCDQRPTNLGYDPSDLHPDVTQE